MLNEMKGILKDILLWLLSIAFTLLVVYYQRTTGPTYPRSGSVNIEGVEIGYNLLRSHGGSGDAPVQVEVPDNTFKGILSFKRYKSNDSWTTREMGFVDGALVDSLPHQPPAGKVMYKVTLIKNGKSYPLTGEPVILRFKGAVPLYILIPHILFMFMVMLFGIRAAVEVFSKGKKTKSYVAITLVSLIAGGLILGPIVQKFAFGVYWSGWPFGHDLTDNKTIFVFVFWLIAWFKVRKNHMHRIWVIVATVVMLVVYSIPHSVMGSEIDYTKQNTEQQK
jgi:hypothetical protein